MPQAAGMIIANYMIDSSMTLNMSLILETL